MKILVLNAGSSSLKFSLYNKKKEIAKGIVDAINKDHCELKLRIDKAKVSIPKKIKTHNQAIKESLNILIESKIIKDFKEIKAVCHRVVHGGEDFKKATIINESVINKIKKLIPLAPLHNPHNLSGIIACKKLLKAKQFAIFDTAFHNTLPKKAFIYPIPLKLYEKEKIRRYGFHGTSHKYVFDEAKKLLKKEKCKTEKVITCHLGNGSSLCAIKDGKSIDISMGLTPLEGIPMGTRCGSIDPAIPIKLLSKYSKEEVDEILNKKSGFIGLSGISTDMRVIYSNEVKGNKKAKLVIEILTYKIAQFIGSYTVSLGGLDALVFTGGIGENAFYIREKVCEYLKFLGLELDKKKNWKNEKIISNKKSKIRAYVIPTNEELQMVKEVLPMLK